MNILGYPYRVIIGPTYDELGAFGRRCERLLTIHVACDLAPAQAESTILHEIIETCAAVLGLDWDHSVVQMMEVALFQTLTANGVDLAPLLAETGDEADA